MKYFVFEEDGLYEEIMELPTFQSKYPLAYEKYMADNFGSDFNTGKLYALTAEHQYNEFYELDTQYTIEQVKSVVEYDFLYCKMELLKVLGKLTKIIKSSRC